ncbi:hydroxypyruvate isomerase [Monaibacterium marinum]|uniref:Hydroxypyruvate isomerase n=1 Tax=Pontivivens marinum TaxID=1690039 RepID=A0A2C9CV67_9RHOB|nr:TIM barrel protein [Monaibacterium marinum]SOH95162.1 hydroxypyruvate isomerase [Monaibacterium marinum]
MTQFSANLGFLWTELPLPDAIRAAAAAGFEAVECHWPYETPAEDVRMALHETGLPMLALNTVRGDAGQNGLSALPDRQEQAQHAIDQAIGYARRIGVSKIHVMAGIAQGAKAHDTFVANLRYACGAAVAHGITILIEPLNAHDAPGYFLNTLAQAANIIAEVERDNLKLMFDCYHVARTEGDVASHLQEYLPMIGHIQFASVPERAQPDGGDLDYAEIFALLDRLGWDQPLGAEYRPSRETGVGLGWMQTLRAD